MDIVCPVQESDFDRFCILYKSLNKFCEDSFRLYLISPSGESPIISSKIIPIKESKLDKNISKKLFKNKGWWKQQIIKLLSFKFCEDNAVLVLDSDCFAVKPFTFSKFLYKNKIKTKVSSGGSFDHWYYGSSDILKLKLNFNFKQNRVGVTPFIFSNSILEGLYKYLKIIYPDPVKYLLENTSVNPNTNFIWTEYCLYHIYGKHSGFWDKYHYESQTFDLCGNSFWNYEESLMWDSSKSFENPEFYFTVAQSTAKQSVSWVQERIINYVN
jgi:hypothetical protein